MAAALVTEELACHFETELRGGAAPFYAEGLDRAGLEALWRRAQIELYSPSYDHKAWFLGSREPGIPRHAGYTLGFDLVQRCIQS